MKARSLALTGHHNDAVQTRAWCWRVTRTDGQVFGFTSVDRDLVIDGVTYAAATGISPYAIAGRSDLSVQNMQVAGLLDSTGITEEDIAAGLWDGASVVNFEVNFDDLTQGTMVLATGVLGPVRAGRVAFEAELRGLAQRLQQPIGEVFTIAGVYACHPETKAPYSSLQQFTITAIGASTTTVSPTIYLTGPRKNVVSSTGATLATTDFNSKTLTFIGSASTSYVQNLMYHKEAFQFITADLPIMDDASKCVRRQQDGLSLRVWQASDIRNDEMLMRIDILYGMAALRPEWACRITS